MSKADFPLLQNKNIAYFDTAATSQKPKQVLDEITNYYENSNANTHRSIYPLAQEATEELERSRKEIAAFIGATPEEIIFTKNTTESLNLLAHAMPQMNTVLTTMYEHHSNYLPWQQNTESFVVCNSFNELVEKTNDQTTLVTFTGMSNVTGIIPNVKEIIDGIKAKNSNVVTVVDACQLIVHESINVQDLGCDALAFSAHKLYGPLGVGILYIKKDLQEKLSPFLLGGGMVDNAKEKSWNNGPQKFEAGTQDVAGIVATAEAIEYFKAHHNHEQEQQITQALLDFLKSEGVQVVGHDEKDKYGSIISFVVPSAYDFAVLLGEEGVCVRSGHHCAQPLLEALDINHTVRISVGIYNDMDDVETFKEAFTKVKNKIPIN